MGLQGVHRISLEMSWISLCLSCGSLVRVNGLGSMARGQGPEVKVWGGQGLVRDQVSVVMGEAWWVRRPSGLHRPMAKKSRVRMARVRGPCLVLNLAWDIAKTIAKAYGNIRCAKKRWSHVKLGKSNPNTYPWGPPGQEIPRKCKVSEIRVRKHSQNHRKTLYFQGGCMSGSSWAQVCVWIFRKDFFVRVLEIL